MIEKQTAKNYSPLTLAFLGDSVYELLVRQKIISDPELSGGSLPPRKLHTAAVAKVRASFQAAGVRAIEPLLSEEEADIVRRGRNANSHVPKSSSVAEYRLATGLEALFGYLHLIGKNERIEELFEIVCKGKSPVKDQPENKTATPALD